MKKIISHIKKYKFLYIMLIPAIIWYLIFNYGPMGGLILSFKEYRYDMGVLRSPWVGMKHFKTMLNDQAFLSAFKNTWILAFGKLIIHMPVPIITALLINEVYNDGLKRYFQTVFTFPHFVSWVVLGTIFTNLFSGNGLVNQIMAELGRKSFSPLIDPRYYRGFVILSNLWKEFGWDSIIYLAAIAGINPSLYEAAEIDGAGRFQQIRYITLPGISNIISIMFILQIGNMLGATNFNQIFNTYSAPVYGVGDIIDTYVQRFTFVMGADFGYTTAVGLVKSVISLVLIYGANKIVSRRGYEGLI